MSFPPSLNIILTSGIGYDYIILCSIVMSYHKSYHITSHDIMWMHLNLTTPWLLDTWVIYDVYNIKNAAMNILVYDEILSSSPAFFPENSFQKMKTLLTCVKWSSSRLQRHTAELVSRGPRQLPPSVCLLAERFLSTPETCGQHPSELTLRPVLYGKCCRHGRCWSSVKQTELSSMYHVAMSAALWA